MYYQKRGDSYSFVYFDSVLKKNVRLHRNAHPQFSKEDEAKEFCKRWDARVDAMKCRVRKRLEWMEKYFDFKELLEIFGVAKKEDAPHKWRDYVSLMKFYVLPFFLTKKSANNLNLWHYHFEEFRDHLQSEELLTRKKSGKNLSYATMNQIINALNGFMDTMYRRSYIEAKHLCRHFESHKLNRRGEESVMPTEIQEQLHEKLHTLNPLAADFFWVALHTGMRLNEVFGISLDDIHTDSVEADFMRRALLKCGLKPYGFIALESQPSHEGPLRDELLKVKRKPLKGKKKIDPKDCRIIPICDKEAYNILVRLWNEQRKHYEARRYGPDMKDYLLFGELPSWKYSNLLKTAQLKLKSKKRYTAHDTRHTYSTWLADVTAGEYTLNRMILGHHDIDMTMRYVHINAKLQRQMKSKQQLVTRLEMAV